MIFIILGITLAVLLLAIIIVIICIIRKKKQNTNSDIEKDVEDGQERRLMETKIINY